MTRREPADETHLVLGRPKVEERGGHRRVDLPLEKVPFLPLKEVHFVKYNLNVNWNCSEFTPLKC